MTLTHLRLWRCEVLQCVTMCDINRVTFATNMSHGLVASEHLPQLFEASRVTSAEHLVGLVQYGRIQNFVHPITGHTLG